MALESLVRIAGHRKTSHWIKDQLYSTGALQWLVFKGVLYKEVSIFVFIVEHAVDTLLSHPDRYDEIELMEKCLSILETVYIFKFHCIREQTTFLVHLLSSEESGIFDVSSK